MQFFPTLILSLVAAVGLQANAPDEVQPMTSEIFTPGVAMPELEESSTAFSIEEDLSAIEAEFKKLEAEFNAPDDEVEVALKEAPAPIIEIEPIAGGAPESEISAPEPSAVIALAPIQKSSPVEVNLQKAFTASPVIYSVLVILSVAALAIWLYTILSLRTYGNLSVSLIANLRNKFNSNHYEDALNLCQQQDSVFAKMVASGIQSRRHGLPVMVEAMKAEGKRASISLWQRLGLLNDIAIIAPMLGLLGTVLGMFYAFYDINRSIESVSTLFDGLGVSVGTTVGGLLVAIVSLILHSLAKYQLVKTLNTVENEAQSLATLMDHKPAFYQE